MEIEDRKRAFMRDHIGQRSREELAEELWGVYLLCRAKCPDVTEAAPDDTWQMDLHLADVLTRIIRQAQKETPSSER